MNRTILGNIDKITTFIYLVLVFFGWINIYSVSPDKANKQLIWILLSLVLIIFLFIFKPNDYKYFSFLFYFFSILLLLLVLILGKSINGSKAWFDLKILKFQPSELAKITTALAISRYLSTPNINILNNKILFRILILILIPIILILLQPDPGSVLVFMSFLLVFYREGFSIKFIFFGIFLIFLFLLSININNLKLSLYTFIIYILYIISFYKKKLIFIIYKLPIFFLIIFYIFICPVIFNKILKQHHRNRILILFKNEFDIKYRNNIGYNLFSSKAAIASGELYGKGFLQGTVTKGRFVPEQFTDYIFCTVAEEWGFIGGTLLIIIYLLFIGRIYFLSENQKDHFGRIFGYSVGSILLFHLFINLGMVMGLVPTVGIPLPFFSYGGSSLWSFTILVFLFIRLNAYDKKSLI